LEVRGEDGESLQLFGENGGPGVPVIYNIIEHRCATTQHGLRLHVIVENAQ